jgi:hypothetical protein
MWFPTSVCFNKGHVTRYGAQVLVKEWHHIPLGHTVFAGPQAHVADACRLFSHQVSGCAPNSLNPWRSIPNACTDPTDIVVASNAIAKFLSIFSSLDQAVTLYMSGKAGVTSTTIGLMDCSCLPRSQQHRW